MAQKTVTEIPANPLLGDLRKRKRKLRVAAYCRVSTEEEEQQNSFEVQVAYYTDMMTCLLFPPTGSTKFPRISTASLQH